MRTIGVQISERGLWSRRYGTGSLLFVWEALRYEEDESIHAYLRPETSFAKHEGPKQLKVRSVILVYTGYGGTH